MQRAVLSQVSLYYFDPLLFRPTICVYSVWVREQVSLCFFDPLLLRPTNRVYSVRVVGAGFRVWGVGADFEFRVWGVRADGSRGDAARGVVAGISSPHELPISSSLSLKVLAGP